MGFLITGALGVLVGICFAAWAVDQGRMLTEAERLQHAKRLLKEIAYIPPSDDPTTTLNGADVIQAVWLRRSRFLN